MENFDYTYIDTLIEQNELLSESNEILLELVTEQNNVLSHIYATNLFCIGTFSAVFVCVLLYKFIKLFF